jgi:CubicO group peptidase (beta-lactamase class C family)
MGNVWVHLRRERLLATVGLIAAVGAGLAAAPAQAARSCEEPGRSWSRASAADVGMDAAKLRDAVDYGTSQASSAVRVFRHGCLVAEDRLAPATRDTQFESWSLAKSITALVFGRAMTLGLISPDDPIGSLLPEADGPHGAITARDLLTMTGGLRWNGLRDYDIFMPDRLRDALTVDVVRPPGTFYEYSQSGPALLAEAVSRAVGEDFQTFAQRELFGPLGIEAGSWMWRRDAAGHTQGFFGLNMNADDFGRLGELMRRKGVWRGKRLLSQRVVREAVSPTATNGCYGWMIWVNAAVPCVSPRVSERPVSDERSFPGLPSDMYYYAGLFGQLVAVFPSQGVIVVRTGQEAGPDLAGGGGYQAELYGRVLGAITDEEVPEPAPPAPAGSVDRGDVDRGFQTSVFEPGEFTQPFTSPPLPPAGPERARAARLRLAHGAASRTGRVSVRMTCPARSPGRDARACTGTATLQRARRALSYTLAAGETRVLRFSLTSAGRRSLRRAGRLTLEARAVNRDAAGGTPAGVPVSVRRPR